MLKRNQDEDCFTGIYTGDSESDDEMEEFRIMRDRPYAKDAVEGLRKVVVEVPKEEWQELWKPWRRALVVKPLGRNISYRVLSQRLNDLWMLSGRLEIIDLEEGFYVVRFYNPEDYWHVLNNGPWIIQGHYLTITKLRPGFHPFTNHVSSTLVWARVPRLPLELFGDKVLMRIGNKLGKAVKIDVHSMKVSRAKYARVCVEVDLRQALLSAVIIDGEEIKVEYENLHLICFICGKYGHRSEDCPCNPNVTPVVQEPSPPLTPTEKPTGAFGPWMIARSRNRQRVTPKAPAVQDIPSNGKVNVPRNHDVQRKESRNANPPMGSRFSPIFNIEDVDDLSPQVDKLAENIRNINDLGPPVLFNATTKDQLLKTKEKRGKGIP